MRLPSAEHVLVEAEKVSEYLLSETHPVGRLKAQFFVGLGFRWGDPDALVAALRALAREGEIVEWHARDEKGVPRLVTAYPAPR